MKATKTVVFITGAFLSHKVWNKWIAYFTSKGYTCYAPCWPYKDATPQELRDRQPNDKELANLRLNELINHFINFIRELPEKPVVIGHSLGGLIAQIVVNRDLVAAGVAIHSATPKGIFSFEWSFLKSIWKPIGYFSSKSKTYLMGIEDWKYAFTNGMSDDEQLIAYDDYVIPESRRVLRDVLSNAAKIDFNKAHPPLLLITGTNDNFVPNSLSYENYIRYNKNHSITDYKEFKDKNHFVLGLQSWHDEADYILSWIEILNHKL